MEGCPIIAPEVNFCISMFLKVKGEGLSPCIALNMVN